MGHILLNKDQFMHRYAAFLKYIYIKIYFFTVDIVFLSFNLI